MKYCNLMGAQQFSRIRSCHKKDECSDKINFGNSFFCKRPLMEDRCSDLLLGKVGGVILPVCMNKNKCTGQEKKKESVIVLCKDPLGVPA